MTEPRRTVTLTEFLTSDEIAQAVDLYKTARAGTFASLCEADIVRPILPRIETSLGQKMYPRYVAYMIEFVLMQADRKGQL